MSIDLPAPTGWQAVGVVSASARWASLGDVWIDKPPTNDSVPLEDFVVMALARLVGPELVGVLADWMRDRGRDAQADRLQELALEALEEK